MRPWVGTLVTLVGMVVASSPAVPPGRRPARRRGPPPARASPRQSRGRRRRRRAAAGVGGPPQGRPAAAGDVRLLRHARSAASAAGVGVPAPDVDAVLAACWTRGSTPTRGRPVPPVAAAVGPAGRAPGRRLPRALEAYRQAPRPAAAVRVGRAGAAGAGRDVPGGPQDRRRDPHQPARGAGEGGGRAEQARAGVPRRVVPPAPEDAGDVRRRVRGRVTSGRRWRPGRRTFAAARHRRRAAVAGRRGRPGGGGPRWPGCWGGCGTSRPRPIMRRPRCGTGKLTWVKKTDSMDPRKKLTHLHQALVEAAKRAPKKPGVSR